MSTALAIGLYWTAGAFAATALWAAACEITRWLHRSIDQAATLPAGSHCHCGTCPR